VESDGFIHYQGVKTLSMFHVLRVFF